MYGVIKRKIADNTWLLALLITCGVILVGIFVAWYNNKVIPGNTGALARYPGAAGNPLGFLGEWDSRYFTGIAQHGYTRSTDTAFFPLYPIAIKIVDFAVHAPLMSALLVSWASLYGAIYYYLKLVPKLWRVDLSEKLQACLFLIIFPTAMFMLAAYSEALFVFLSLAALYFCLSKQYWLSGLFLAGATATRATGIFTVILILLIMLMEHRQSIKKVIAVGLIGIAGLVAYSVFLQLKFGNSLQFISAESYWGRFSGGYLNSLTASASLLNIAMAALIILTAAYWFYKRRTSFAVYSLLFLAIPIITGSLISLNRFALADFPLMFMLYDWSRGKPAWRSVLLCVSAIFWAYFLLQFAAGYNGG